MIPTLKLWVLKLILKHGWGGSWLPEYRAIRPYWSWGPWMARQSLNKQLAIAYKSSLHGCQHTLSPPKMVQRKEFPLIPGGRVCFRTVLLLQDHVQAICEHWEIYPCTTAEEASKAYKDSGGYGLKKKAEVITNNDQIQPKNQNQAKTNRANKSKTPK